MHAAPEKVTEPLGAILVEKGLVNQKQLAVALSQQRVTGAKLGDTLISLGFLTAQDLSRAMAQQSGLEYLDLRTFTISEEALRLVPRETALRHSYLPLDLTDGALAIATMSPHNILAVDSAFHLTGKQPTVYLVDREAFHDVFERAYYFAHSPVHKRLEEFCRRLEKGAVSDLMPEVVELLIMDGIQRMASDVHLTPSNEVLHVFYRVDGVLIHGHCLPRAFHSVLASRIKVMAELDITEQRLPQDGAFTHSFFNKRYDLRVSTVPTIYGENVVIRILSAQGSLRHISTLGLSPAVAASLRQLFNKSHGIILITGPTGSGKTTTLYSCLKEIDLLEKNVLTIEDPVEYHLNFVRQTEFNEKTGYTFSSVVKNFMRQDPDVMLLGEIRDRETAEMAVRGSITGHLLLSTLHASDAVASIPRLLDLGMGKLLLSTTLLAVLAQRLVRRICPFCKEGYQLDAQERDLFVKVGLDVQEGFRGAGCQRCGDTGFAGRTAIVELLVVNPEISELIYAGASSESILQAALRAGMAPLLTDGLSKAAAGVTTVREVQRVAG